MRVDHSGALVGVLVAGAYTHQQHRGGDSALRNGCGQGERRCRVCAHRFTA
ncbi:hypothetical protein MA4S0206_1112 [Mycobacteroides abscessus 4S-0206]|nr:hypothetical protein MA4S0206_1112 [Mycobacteroides abscessus 4S-0206]